MAISYSVDTMIDPGMRQHIASKGLAHDAINPMPMALISDDLHARGPVALRRRPINGAFPQDPFGSGSAIPPTGCDPDRQASTSARVSLTAISASNSTNALRASALVPMGSVIGSSPVGLQASCWGRQRALPISAKLNKEIYPGLTTRPL